MYQAIVSKIKVQPHPNADRLQVGYAHGFQVVIGKDIEDGELGVFFPTDGVLSDAFCQANSLYPIYDENGNRVGGGFIDPKSRRVRAQNFRGVKSEGFWVPMSYFAYLGKNLELHKGEIFTEVAGQKICEKYFNPATQQRLKRGEKDQKVTLRETPMFPMHLDTPQLKYYINSLELGSTIYISSKCHGTSGRTSYALDPNPPSLRARLKLAWETLLND